MGYQADPPQTVSVGIQASKSAKMVLRHTALLGYSEEQACEKQRFSGTVQSGEHPEHEESPQGCREAVRPPSKKTLAGGVPKPDSTLLTKECSFPHSWECCAGCILQSCIAMKMQPASKLQHPQDNKSTEQCSTSRKTDPTCNYVVELV